MKEHLRFSIVYWHTFRGTGADPFGPGTADRPWDDGTDSVENAQNRARVAFELFEKLQAPYYAFHDRDVAPEGATLAESHRNFDAVADVLEAGTETQWRQVAVGYGEHVQQSAVHARRGNQLQRRRVCLRGITGQEGAGGHPSSWWRELCVLGRS